MATLLRLAVVHQLARIHCKTIATAAVRPSFTGGSHLALPAKLLQACSYFGFQHQPFRAFCDCYDDDRCGKKKYCKEEGRGRKKDRCSEKDDCRNNDCRPKKDRWPDRKSRSKKNCCSDDDGGRSKERRSKRNRSSGGDECRPKKRKSRSKRDSCSDDDEGRPKRRRSKRDRRSKEDECRPKKRRSKKDSCSEDDEYRKKERRARKKSRPKKDCCQEKKEDNCRSKKKRRPKKNRCGKKDKRPKKNCRPKRDCRPKKKCRPKKQRCEKKEECPKKECPKKECPKKECIPSTHFQLSCCPNPVRCPEKDECEKKESSDKKGSPSKKDSSDKKDSSKKNKKRAMYKVVMIRHGESEWNAKNRFCGWYDSKLSAKGKKEACAAGKAIKEAKLVFNTAHTSLLTRAQETLSAVLEASEQRNVSIYKTWRLNERHYGCLTGLNKNELANEVGEEQVEAWRRSFDEPPPPMNEKHEYYKAIRNDPRYENGPTDANFPDTESLEMTIERTMPYWDNVIMEDLEAGKKVIISAHGNSLRGIVMRLEDMSEEDVAKLNLPTGIPFIYELDKDMKPIGPRKFLGDPAAVKQSTDAVANQGKANKKK